MTDQPTPSRLAGLRDEIAHALIARIKQAVIPRQEPWQTGQIGSIFAATEFDLADAVMPVLYREWPWLQAEAEDAAAQPAPEPDGTGLYDKIADMFGGPLPWPSPATPICGAPGPWGDAHACIKPAAHPDAHRAHDGCGWHDEPARVPAATEPAMITDPAYLHHLYADAIRNTPARYPDDIATAIMNVRDRHMQQLRQRLDLAAAELNERNKQDSADAAAGSYAHRAEHAEQQRDQLAAVLREVLDQFADWPTDGFPWPQGGVVARVDPTEWDRWDTVHTAITAPPAHLAELVGDTTLEDQ